MLTLIPKYGAQVVWTLTQYARQRQGAASFNIQVDWTQDVCFRFC